MHRALYSQLLLFYNTLWMREFSIFAAIRSSEWQSIGSEDNDMIYWKDWRFALAQILTWH
jgi:hypothetical protein